MHHRHGFLFLFITLVISGCAAPYVPAPLPVTHPASPTATEAPVPPPSQVFASENRPPTPVEEMPLQNPHAGHSAMQGMHGGH